MKMNLVVPANINFNLTFEIKALYSVLQYMF